MARGSPKMLASIETIADGLAPVIAGQLTFEHARELMDDVVTVNDKAIRMATLQLIEHEKLIVEYSGAATTAALLSEKVNVQGRRVAAVVSGGNLDAAILAKLV